MLYITLKRDQEFICMDSGVPESVLVPKGKYEAKMETRKPNIEINKLNAKISYDWAVWKYDGKKVGANISFIRKRSDPAYGDSQIILSEE